MKKKKSPINIMIDAETKEQATQVLDQLGLSMSTAITIYLKQIIKIEGIPFEIKVSNKSTINQQ